MAVGFLLTLALTENETISSTPGLCKQVRYRQSECRECVDNCPEGAITMDLGPRINDACRQCGICVNVCPTEVFQHEFNMDQHLLDQINSLIDENHGSKRKKSFHIHCQQAEKQDEESSRVTCLGSISENVILGGALSGLDELVLISGHCPQCRLVPGEALLRNAIATFRMWQQSLALEGFVVRLEENQKEKGKTVGLSRRKFLSSIAQPAKNKSGSVRNPVKKTAVAISNGKRNTQKFTRPSPKKESLRQLLRQHQQSCSFSGLPGKPSLQTMKVDDKNCIACGICVAVCPTGALHKEHTEGRLIRYFNSALCSSCNLCMEACPQQVISFEEEGNITSLIEGTIAVVARIDLNSCTICGETIPRTEGEICLTCQKRQVSPLFM